MPGKPKCELGQYSLALAEQAPAMLGVDSELFRVDGNGKSDAFRDRIDHGWLQAVHTVATKMAIFVMFDHSG